MIYFFLIFKVEKTIFDHDEKDNQSKYMHRMNTEEHDNPDEILEELDDVPDE